MMYTRAMEPILEGFSDELEKLAKVDEFEKQRRALNRDLRRVTREKGKHPLESLRGKSSPRQRDYLATAAIGATAYPAIALMTAALSRKLSNRSLMKAMRGAGRKERKMLKTRLDTAPLVGPVAGAKAPKITTEKLTSQAARGVLVGSLIQMLRDRFAGSTPV